MAAGIIEFLLWQVAPVERICGWGRVGRVVPAAASGDPIGAGTSDLIRADSFTRRDPLWIGTQTSANLEIECISRHVNMLPSRFIFISSSVFYLLAGGRIERSTVRPVSRVSGGCRLIRRRRLILGKTARRRSGPPNKSGDASANDRLDKRQTTTFQPFNEPVAELLPADPHRRFAGPRQSDRNELQVALERDKWEATWSDAAGLHPSAE